VVRGAIGQEFKGRSYAEDWLIVDAQNVPKPIDHVEFLCDHHRPTPHMVAPGGRERWEFMLKPGETREQMEQLDAIRVLLKPWGGPEQMHIERRAVYRFHARCCESFLKGRVLLAGDAAHITPPFVGQGLVAGLRDAANLCWKLAWVVRGHASPEILNSYDRERRPHAKAMIALARAMGQVVMPRNAPTAIVVHGFMRLMRVMPSTRRFFEELGAKPKQDFREGLFASGRGKLRRGGCIPQTIVRDEQGRMCLSDDIFGPHMTLVGFGLDPSRHLTSRAREAWSARGGRIVQVCVRGEALHRGEHLAEDLTGALVPGLAPYGWAAVLRPDRTVVTDGAVTEAERLVQETLRLFGDGPNQDAEPRDKGPVRAAAAAPSAGA
jgi:3-(3-hydroxy-phenyl)propionate hydroxylase